MRQSDRGSEAWQEKKALQRRSAESYDIDRWYTTLKSVTFPTAFVRLSISDAEAMIAVYKHRELRGPPTTADHLRAIAGLRRQITRCMQSMHLGRDQQSRNQRAAAGYFVRLTSRSPKDAAVVTKDQFTKQFEHLKSVEPNSDHTNLQLRAYFEASAQAQRVTNADGALSLLLASERVYCDLLEACAAFRKVGWTTQIAIREWSPRLRQEYEFRGFVHKSEFNAVCQYNHYCIYPLQYIHRHTLLAKLRSFWCTRVRDVLQPAFDSYVVDFAILSDGTVTVVELNPFDSATGGAMYHWGIPEDRRVLENGPLSELRMATTPLNGADDMLDYLRSTLVDSDDDRHICWDFGEVIDHGCIAFDNDEPVESGTVDDVASTYVVVAEHNDAVLPGVSGLSSTEFQSLCPVEDTSFVCTFGVLEPPPMTGCTHAVVARAQASTGSAGSREKWSCNDVDTDDGNEFVATMPTTHVEAEVQSQHETRHSLHNKSLLAAQPLEMFESITLREAATTMAMTSPPRDATADTGDRIKLRTYADGSNMYTKEVDEPSDDEGEAQSAMHTTTASAQAVVKMHRAVVCLKQMLPLDRCTIM
eukprot:m.753962 g.753962  ORF g.753962 m.753962 type:complete len:588 (+) comp23175_c0_seq4:179-1942(+)